MSEKKEERRAARKLRKANRKQRRLTRRAERQARRAARREGRVSLKVTIAEKVNRFLDHEFEKIQQEKQQALASGENLQSAQKLQDPKVLLGQYLLKAAARSASTGFLPGLMGMVTIVPEIVGNLKNQLRMVYDIGVANGYPPDTHKDIILYVFLDSLGKRLTGFGIRQDNKIIVKPNDMNTLSYIGKIIAGYAVSQLVRSLVCKWLPGVGGVALTAWAQQSIFKISNNANALFQHEIVLGEPTAPSTADEARLVQTDEQATEEERDDADFIKFLTLIDLVRQDGKVGTKEKGLFLQMMQNSDFEDDEKAELLSLLDSDEDLDPDLSFLKENSDDVAALMFDLVALTMADGVLHEQESAYLYDIAEELGFPEEQLKGLLDA